MERLGASLIVLAAVLAALAGCGEEQTRFNDTKIVDQLNLEKTEGGGYAIDGDPFCEVTKRLLNNSDEVNSAADKDDLGLVIASKQGNAGVEGRPPFAPDCEERAKKKLNKLDPKPKE